MVEIVVFRPRVKGQDLVKRLAEAGYVAKNFEVFRIEPLSFVFTESCSRYSDLIFVSTNAVHHFFAHIDHRSYWLTELKFWAIGCSTANALAQYNIHALFPKQQNSEGLFALLTTHGIEKSRKFLLIKGVGGRDWLRQQLCLRAQVDTLDCYQRVAIKEEALISTWRQEVNICPRLMIFTSLEGLKIFSPLFAVYPLVKKTCIVVTNFRMMRLVVNSGCHHVYLTQNLDNGVLVKKVCEYLSTGNF